MLSQCSIPIYTYQAFISDLWCALLRVPEAPEGGLVISSSKLGAPSPVHPTGTIIQVTQPQHYHHYSSPDDKRWGR